MPITRNLSNLDKLDDFSAFLSLIGLILSIQSTQIARKSREEDDNQTRTLSDKIITIAVFIAASSNFIDLGTAKAAYEKLLESPNVSQRKISASHDLLMSRYFSTLAALYLIRATLKTTSENLQELITPTGLGGIT